MSVDQQENEEMLLQKICEAAAQGDTAKVQALLQSKTTTTHSNNSDLDTPLLEESPISASLRSHVLLGNSFLSPDLILRALLMVPACYETPWRTCVDVVRALHAEMYQKRNTTNHKAHYTCVAEIQSFLQQTVALWWKRETQKQSATKWTTNTTCFTTPSTADSSSSTTTPRQWLEMLAETSLTPLFVTDSSSEKDDTTEEAVAATHRPTTSRDNRHWMLPLELVTTIVSLFSDYDASTASCTIDRQISLSTSILNRLFCFDNKKKKKRATTKRTTSQILRPDRLINWLTLASDLQTHLRNDDWTSIPSIVEASLESIPHTDLPGIVRTITSFVVRSVGQQQQQNETETRPYYQLLLQLLGVSSNDPSTYSTVETVLQSSLDSLATPVLHQWKQSLDTISKQQQDTQQQKQVPCWILANMHLLLLQAVEQSGSKLVSSLVAHALKLQQANTSMGGGDDLTQQCWHTLVQLVFPTSSSTPRPKRKRGRGRTGPSQLEVAGSVQNALQGVTYTGGGQFTSQPNVSLPFSSKLVCESIFLGNKSLSKRAHQFHAAERAQLWVHAANTVLCPPIFSTRNATWRPEDMLLAVLIVVTVYQEVPASRTTLVRTMLQIFSDQQAAHLQKLHCTALSVIVRSQLREANDAAAHDEGLQDLHPLSDVFSQSIPADLFQDLASALSLLPPARRALLSASRKYLASPFGSNIWWGVSLENNRVAQEKRDRIHSAIYGLCTLLSTKVGIRDDCAEDAWILLSDVLVVNKPALALSARTWLYQCVMRFALEGRFAPETLQRFLRATLVRLLQYFETNKNDALRFEVGNALSSWRTATLAADGQTQTTVNEDLSGLTKLLLRLLECDTKASLNSHEKTRLLNRCHGRMVQILLARRDKSSMRMQMHPFERPDVETDESELLCYKAATSTIISILRYMVADPSEMSGNERQVGSEEDLCRRLVSKLVDQESAECCKDYKRIPIWVQTPPVEADGRRFGPTNDSIETKRLISSFCDLFISTVLNPNWDDVSAGEGTADDAKNVALVVNYLIQVKRGLAEMNQDNQLPEINFDQDMLRSCTAPILEMSKDLLTSSIRDSWSISATNDILEISLVICRSMPALLADEGAQDRKIRSITESVVSLYKSTASEHSSKALIAYLEKCCLEAGEKQESKSEKSLSLHSVKTDDDIDGFIRYVRITILSALQECLRSVSTATNSVSDRSPALWDSSAARVKSTITDVTYWVESLDLLTSDLREGLEGDSGGLTDKLYTSYLDAIESSCAITSGVCTNGSVGLRSLVQVARQARHNETLLRDLLFRYPLKGSSPFKKTLLLAAHFLPSLRRVAARMYFMMDEVLDMNDINHGSVFSCVVLSQALDVFTEWYQLGLKPTTLWEDIVDKDRLHADDYSSSEDDRDEETKEDNYAETVPSVVVIRPSKQEENSAVDSTDGTMKLKLPSKDTWSWSLSCAILSMEQNWMESYQNLQLGGQMRGPSIAVLRHYVSYRRNELAQLMLATTEVLDTINGCDDSKHSSSKHQPDLVVAMALPDVVKARLCALFDRMTIVLLASVRRLITHAQRDIEEDLPAVAEAVACIATWSLLSPNSSLDFIGRTRRWYKAEREKSSAAPETSGGVYSSEDPVLGRLPKVLFRMEELERNMHRLHRTILKLEKKSALPKGVHQLDDLLGKEQSDKRSRRADARAPETSFREMIQEKIKQSSHQDSFGMAIADSSLTSGPEEGEKKNKRGKRALEIDTRVRKERRRRVVRSRNQLVDKWLNLDQEYEKDEGYNDDAYVDLEDFLVDG